MKLPKIYSAKLLLLKNNIVYYCFSDNGPCIEEGKYMEKNRKILNCGYRTGKPYELCSPIKFSRDSPYNVTLDSLLYSSGKKYINKSRIARKVAVEINSQGNSYLPIIPVNYL